MKEAAGSRGDCTSRPSIGRTKNPETRQQPYNVQTSIIRAIIVPALLRMAIIIIMSTKPNDMLDPNCGMSLFSGRTET